jgi:hypothetical protein
MGSISWQGHSGADSRHDNMAQLVHGKRRMSIRISIAEIIPYDAIPVPYKNLKDKCSTFCLLFSTQFKMLASFQWQLSSIFALITLQTQHNLLCRFCLQCQNPLIRPARVPFCGRQVSFDHHNHFVSCRIVVFPDVSIFDD